MGWDGPMTTTMTMSMTMVMSCHVMSCHISYYYDSPDGLASARYQLMTHVVYVCTAEALLLATAALLFGNDRFGRGCVVNGRDLCP